jgi:hypothetical protein
LLHEGAYSVRRDYQGEYDFTRAGGRAIPRCGYRAGDYTDDDSLENPSMEVREERSVYRPGLQRR